MNKSKYKHRSDEQKSALYNTETIYKSQQAVIEFSYDYSWMGSEARNINS